MSSDADTDQEIQRALLLSLSQDIVQHETEQNELNAPFHSQKLSSDDPQSSSTLSTKQPSKLMDPYPSFSFVPSLSSQNASEKLHHPSSSQRSRKRNLTVNIMECVEPNSQHSVSETMIEKNPKKSTQQSHHPIRRLYQEDDQLFHLMEKASLSTQRTKLNRTKRPRKLLAVQTNALYFARRFLFSALSGDEQVRTHDPPLDALGFDTFRLAQILKFLGIAATTDDINAMMLFWHDPRLSQCNHSDTFKAGFCQECWNDQQDQKAYETSKAKCKDHTKLSTLQCDWQHFCWIFDACQLKAEKNGVVW